MASGDILEVFHPGGYEPPATGMATPDQITTNEGERPVLDFDDTAPEDAIWSGVMPTHYSAATGITVDIYGSMDSANTAGTDEILIDVAFERVVVGDHLAALGSASDFAAVNSVTCLVDHSANSLFKCTVTFTAGADVDEVVAGDLYRLKVTRDAAPAGDDATGDFQLDKVVLTDT